MPINSGISSDRSILNIDRETVNAKLGMDACIAIMRQAQIDQYSQTAHCPARNFVQLANDSQLLIMPAASTEIVGTKILTLFPTNTSSDTPVIQGVIVLFDSNTGSPLATIDAASVTAIRTAAASAAATDALSQQNAKSLAIIGSGVQAKSHIEAMMQVRAIETIRIYSRNSNSALQLAEETRALFGIECHVETSPQKAAAGAEIICTVTSSHHPVIYAEWLAPGCHLNLVGAHSPEMREVDTATIKRASVFVEDTEMALKEAGDIAIPIAKGELKRDQIKGDIAEVYLGTKLGRSSSSEITLYKSLGNAIQDITAAHALYKSVT
ncbi:hypothetical protein N8993_14510 [Pseudomonadales bacterium]|nr:hypothetical protein [Pseudomonadales bacterium]